MNKNILITIKKELRSILRDKKALIRMMIFPLIIPAMIILYGTIYENTDSSALDKEYNIGINYDLSNTEQEIYNFNNLNYTKYSSEEELKKEYKDNNIEGYITYDPEIKEYTIYTNNSSTDGMILTGIIESTLEQYSNYLTNEYLLDKQINLEEAYNHFTVEYTDLSNSNYMLVILLTISFTYIVMAICISTSNIAVGVTATEKENGTLETILTFPIKTTELIVGKYIATVTIGIMSSLIGLILTIISIIIGSHFYTMFDNFNLSLSFGTITGSLITIICASLFISGVAITLTSRSKTYKEAQSSVALLNMVCLIPMFVSIIELELNRIYYLIPICNFEQILMDLFTNNIDVINLIIVTISTITYIIIVLIYVIKSYNSEKILFSK